MERFLVIRLSSIGDVILSTPLIRCLRKAFPESRIDFLVKKEFAAVLTNNPHISEIIVYDKQGGLGEFRRVKMLIKERNYHQIIDIQQNIRSILFSVGTRAAVTTFSKKLWKRFLLIRLRINAYREVKPVYLRYMEAVESLGITYDGLGTEMFLPEEEVQQAAILCSGAGNGSPATLIAIAPGARWANKRWPAERFAQAANQLAASYNIQAVLIGGSADTDACLHVMQHLEVPVTNLAGKLSLVGSAAMLKQCSLLLTNDTGMMHMAQAVKTPVIAIFGPTTRELGFFPLPENGSVAETKLYCRPCTQKGLDACPKQHFRCMLDIHPSTVASLALEQLCKNPQ